MSVHSWNSLISNKNSNCSDNRQNVGCCDKESGRDGNEDSWQVFDTYFSLIKTRNVKNVTNNESNGNGMCNAVYNESWHCFDSDESDGSIIDEIVRMINEEEDHEEDCITGEDDELSSAMLKYLESRTQVIINEEFNSEDKQIEANAEDTPLETDEKKELLDFFNEYDTNPNEFIDPEKDDVSLDSFESVDDFDDVELRVHDVVKEEIRVSVPIEHDNVSLLKKNKIESIISEIKYTTAEILTTEDTYVESLKSILVHYMPEVNRLDAPPPLKKRSFYLFGHIVKIHDFHNTIFRPALIECNMDCQAIANLFISFEGQFYIYIKNALDSTRMEAVIQDYKSFFEDKAREIGDRHSLHSQLLAPSIRLMKYRLLMERIVDNFTKLLNNNETSWCLNEISEQYNEGLIIRSSSDTLETLQRAVSVLKALLKKADEVNMIPLVYDCPFNLESTHLLKTGKLFYKRKNYKYQVFLFEDKIVFTKPMIAKNEIFFHKDHIFLTEMTIPKRSEHDETKFTLSTASNTIHPKSISVRAANVAERNEWCDKIMELLNLQFKQIKQGMTPKSRMSIFRSATTGAKSKDTVKSDVQTRLVYGGKLKICSERGVYDVEIKLFEDKISLKSVIENILDEEIESKFLRLDSAVPSYPARFIVSCLKSYKAFTLESEMELDKIIWKWKILYVLNKTVPEFLSFSGISNVPGDRRTFPTT